jgi:hypothetical protein
MIEVPSHIFDEFVEWIEERFGTGAAWVAAIISVLVFFAAIALLFWAYPR